MCEFTAAMGDDATLLEMVGGGDGSGIPAGKGRRGSGDEGPLSQCTGSEHSARAIEHEGVSTTSAASSSVYAPQDPFAWCNLSPVDQRDEFTEVLRSKATEKAATSAGVEWPPLG